MEMRLISGDEVSPAFGIQERFSALAQTCSECPRAPEGFFTA